MKSFEYDPMRRRLLQGAVTIPLLPSLLSCAAAMPPLSNNATSSQASKVLRDSADAHGIAALANISDVSVSYSGAWRALVGKLQPALVDSNFRSGSQERLLLRNGPGGRPGDGTGGRLGEGLIAQAHTGPGGHKQVSRQTSAAGQGEIRVWFNGAEARDRERRDAAALVIDGYSIFLLGPMALVRLWARSRLSAMATAGVEHVTFGGKDRQCSSECNRECDVLRLRSTPGLGFASSDELALYIDRKDRLMRRVRFSLNGLESTRGAIAEVDTFDHTLLHGVHWPTRFHERLLKPLPLPVHDWRLTGIDVDRGLEAAEISGSTFTGKAVAPATAVPLQSPT